LLDLESCREFARFSCRPFWILAFRASMTWSCEGVGRLIPWVSKWLARDRLRGLDVSGEMGDNCWGWGGAVVWGDKCWWIGGKTVGEGCMDEGVA
jgi:hypothetical protein